MKEEEMFQLRWGGSYQGELSQTKKEQNREQRKGEKKANPKGEVQNVKATWSETSSS